MNRVRPWFPTAVTGHMQGMTVGPEAIGRVITEADNPALVVGAKMLEQLDGNLIDYVMRMAKAKKMPIAATAHTIGVFVDKKGIEAMSVGFPVVTAMLEDPEWEGMNGKPHDVVIAVGLTDRYLNNGLNSLKNFTEIKTINIGKHNLPNASYSFPNLTDDIWEDYLNRICDYLER